jgi:hypothetical protein
MHNSIREIQICFFLAGIGSLLSLFLFKTQSMSDWWMPLIMVCLTVSSAGLFTLEFLISLRERPKILRFLRRLIALFLGILCLGMAGLSVIRPDGSLPLSRSMIVLSVFAFLSPGLVLSAFGLYLDAWLSKVLGLSRWRIYRYSARLCCLTLGLSPIASLATEYVLRGNSSDIAKNSLRIVFSAFGILFYSENFLRDR